MQTFRILFRLAPAGCFGLPDGNKVVIPVDPNGREVLGPAFDTRTSQLVSHGTLSQYRTPEQSLNLSLESRGLVLSINDNFLSVAVDAQHAQVAADKALTYMEVLLQSLTAMYGERFSASVLSVQDAAGAAQPARIGDVNIHYMKVTTFNAEELRDRFSMATNWAATADSAAKKGSMPFSVERNNHSSACRGSPIPRPSRQREGSESPSAVRVAGQKSQGRQPFGKRRSTKGCVKAKPFGWPTASLDTAFRRGANPRTPHR